MINALTIQNLRGIRQGRIDGLSGLSILVGPNNCGKTTCLEALWTVCARNSKSIVERLLGRGGPPLVALQRTFFGSTLELSIEVERGEAPPLKCALTRQQVRDRDRLKDAIDQGLVEPILALTIVSTHGADASSTMIHLDDAGHLSVPFRVSESPGYSGTIPVAFVAFDTVSSGGLEDSYTRLEVSQTVGQVVKALQKSMTGLTDLRILKVNDTFLLHTIQAGGPPIPAFLTGDGFKRLLNIASMLYSVDGVVLLEEPECYQHPRYMTELVEMIGAAVRRGVQVVVSTHSEELIDRLLVEDLPSGPTVHRLAMSGGVLTSTTLSAAAARETREALFEDLRA
jgi:hypothetical protein